MIPFGRAIAAGTHRRVVLACSAQVGKSDTFLDVIGERLDNEPAPILYTGPSRQFLNEQWEPRIQDLFDEAQELGGKVARGKRNTKTRKIVAGVPLRLAHAGSSTALKSDPFALALTDEADELMRNVKGQGDPITLVDRRGETYADFVHGIVSTPSEGPSEVVRDEASGLEFWALQDPSELDSKIWQLWQEGTRYHWAWPCPHCREFFVPRFSCLDIQSDASPTEVRASTRLICPRNGCIIGADDEQEANAIKAWMNGRGLYVAPGQRVDASGKIFGEPPKAPTLSFWVSGLCSPFTSWGARASEYVIAQRSGDPHQVRTVMNGGFGELWAPRGGGVPDWEVVRARALPYREFEVPAEAAFLTAGVDVQKNRLVYVVRGWGARSESWLITAGEMHGETAQDDVWLDLAEMLQSPFGSKRIRRAFVDAGFRPDKRAEMQEHRVYEFCRRHARLAYATKGYDHRDTPLSVKRLDVNRKGAKAKAGIDLVRLDVDFFKSWVHERILWPVDQPGGWHLYENIAEDFCRQIVSESRIRKPGGGHQWVVLNRNNHFLDCEALAYAAAFMLGVQRMGAIRRPRPEDLPPRRPEPRDEPVPVPDLPAPPVSQPQTQRSARRVFQSSYL